MIYTNADIQFEIEIQNQDCTPFDLSLALDIDVKLYQKRENVLQSFKRTSNTVTVVDASAGLIRVQFDRDNNKNITNADLFADVAVTVDSADSQSGFAILRQSDIFLSKVTVSPA